MFKLNHVSSICMCHIIFSVDYPEKKTHGNDFSQWRIFYQINKNLQCCKLLYGQSNYKAVITHNST